MSSDPLAGRRLGDFVVGEALGSGGMGLVFRARQVGVERDAVVKVLRWRSGVDERLTQRFLREAQLLSRIDHPYAAHLYAFGAEPDGLLWIAMELVRGVPLDQLLKTQGPVPLARFVPFLERLCEVVQTAHDQGIIHRDLKPANVMVLSRAGKLLPKLLDLGIAKLRGDETGAAAPSGAPAAGDLTQEGDVTGSPFYMAPEQWVDVTTVGPPGDVYALGVLAYQSLVGEVPFRGRSQLEIARAHASAPVPELGSTHPVELQAVLKRALAKRASDRFGRAMDFAAAFRAASGLVDREGWPQADEAERSRAVADAPQPLAEAVAALEAARNVHQARDAIWMVARVAARLTGVYALASHLHVRHDGAQSGSVRALRRRSLEDEEWLALAKELVLPFAEQRDAHPIPELVDALGGDELAALFALRAEEGVATEVQVLDLLRRAAPLVTRLLSRLAPLASYPLVVPRGEWAEVWMGAGRGARRRMLVDASLPTGLPVLVDAAGVPVIALAPIVEVAAPAPGEAERLFVIDGRGPRGPRLLALPEGFEREADPQVLGWVEAGGDEGVPAASDRPPFLGLTSFGAADAERFVGRESEAEAFRNRLRVEPLLVVVGPSGAGKSSFVHAGVLPALGWPTVSLRPGGAPLATLEARLATAGEAEPRVVVVDQLEELFTLCHDPIERAAFARRLDETARSADHPVRVIATLRDDFLVRAAELPALGGRIARALHILATPARPELLRIVSEPVARAGYAFDDPELPARMVDEVADRPGALALLSFTGAKLWDLRDRRFLRLRRQAYESLGGVGGALAGHAEECLAELAPEEQRLVREAFRRLVTAEGTRAVVGRRELEEVLGTGARAQAAIEKLVSARILVAAESDHGETVELAHEALLSAWPRLVEWRRDDAEGARLREQLGAAARNWDERGRNRGLLWSGDALAELRRWRARVAHPLTGVEEAFAGASQAHSRRTFRTRAALVGAAFALLVGGVAVLLRLNTVAESQKDALAAQVIAQYLDTGRRALLAGDARLALESLHAAWRRGARGAALDFLLAGAIRATDGRIAQVRHGADVLAVDLSPDGTRLVTASIDGTAKIWDAGRGVLLHDLPHGDWVLDAVFSPDGRLVATASADGYARIWEVATGRLVHRLTAHTQPVRHVEFFPDGRVLTMGKDGLAIVWDARAGIQLLALEHPTSLRAALVAPDGLAVATGTDGGEVRIWDLVTSKARISTPAHEGSVRALAYTLDGRSLASAASDGTIRVWDVATGTPRWTARHRAPINAIAFSPDARQVASAGNDHVVNVWDATSGALVTTFAGHKAGVNRVAFLPDGKTAISAADDGTVIAWQPGNGKRLASFIGHDGELRDLALDASGAHLASAGNDDSAIVWDLDVTRDVTALVGHGDAVWFATFDHHGRRVLTTSADGTSGLWDPENGTRIATIPHGHVDGDVSRGRFSPDDERFVTACTDGAARVWSVPDGRLLLTLGGAGPPLVDAEISHDGKLVVTTGHAGVVTLWDGEIGRPLGRHDGQAYNVAFGPGDDRVISSGDDGARVWDVATATLAGRIDSLPVRAITFDPAGVRMAAATEGNLAYVLDAKTLAPVASLVGHAGEVFWAAFDPRGELIITASVDGTARVWSASTGEVLAVLDLHDAALTSAMWSPDGSAILTGSQDGTARLWRVPRNVEPEELPGLVACRAERLEKECKRQYRFQKQNNVP